MEVVLRRYGNSTVMALPPGLLKNLGLRAGQAMTVCAMPDGGMTLSPVRRHSLKNLLAQCDLKAAPPADLALWDAARPVGQEVW